MASKRQRIARFLLGGGLILFSGVLIYFFYHDRPTGSAPTVVGGGTRLSTEMQEGIDFLRTEKDRKIFQVRAKKHYLDDKGLYQLSGGIEIRIFGKQNQESVQIAADSGYYDKEYLGLFLQGSVKAKLESGLKMSTDSLRYVKDKDLIRSSDTVKFEKGDISGKGNGLSIDVTEKILEFLHKVEFAVKNVRPDLPPVTEVRSRYMMYNDRSKYGIFQDGVEVTNGDSFVKADEVEFTLTEDGGKVKDMEARIDVQVNFAGARRGAGKIAREDDRSLSSIASGAGEKVLKADKAHMTYTPDGRQLAEALAEGNAMVEVVRKKDDKIVYRRVIRGDMIHFFFFHDREGIERCDASGNVSVELFQEGKTRRDRIQKRVFGNAMTATFDPLTEDVATMQFTGKVRFEDQDSQAFGDKGVYDAKGRLLVLTEGNPRVEREGSTVTAQRIEINEETNGLRATGEAKTVYAKKSGEISFFGNADEPVSLSASSMTYDPLKGVALYDGDARAWQGDNVITATKITVDQGQNTFSAASGVKSVLYTSVPQKGRPAGDDSRERLAITVTSDQLLYAEKTRGMTYTSNVVLHRDEADMRSDKCDVTFLKKSNDVDRMQSTGNVIVTQPGRQILGQTADYDVQADSVTLTGKPKVVDVLRGTSSGKILTYFFGDGKVILDGQTQGRTTTVYQPDAGKH